ncbi:GNAT family N-acetyltransferase [Kerstersia gyiorum]|uniref:bifunctional acetate--CoA ligase family protein/GNAT family N-acetyltransferase n=1 Tax=Kerstersia gyiorum TaxID=206506 RepID=UPI003B433202
MLRHLIAPLFDPRTLLVVADSVLPVMQSLPVNLRDRVTWVECTPGVVPVLPEALCGLAPGGRLDLALVGVRPSILPETLARLEAFRPCAAILLPSNEADPNPAATAALCREWATRNQCALLGPNAFGVQRPHAGLNLSQHPILARRGKVALVTQSRALMAAVMDWADDAHIGFSVAVALGDEAVIGLPQVLDFLAGDGWTDSIALYVEDVGFAREFMSALRAAAMVKPVVVLKAGRVLDASGADNAFDAALRRAGAVRVRYFVQLFSALKVLGYARRPRGRSVALLSNGSGPPQLALDLMGPAAAVLPADLVSATRKRLAELLEPAARPANPVITYAPLTPDRIGDLLLCLLDDANVEGVLVLLAPDGRSDLAGVVGRLAQLAPKARKPVITCLMGDAGMRPLRRLMDDAGTPAFRTPESAADAFGVLATHHYNQQLLVQTQPPEQHGDAPDIEGAERVVAAARAQARQELEPAECRALLRAFRVPVAGPYVGCEPPADAMEPPAAIRVRTDCRFGPVLSLGAGGAAAVMQAPDRGADLAPLNAFLARQLMERSRLWQRVLRDHISPSAEEALRVALEQVSDLVTELPDVVEIDIDPLYIGDAGLTAGGMRIRLAQAPAEARPAASGYPHMAIHPYPAQWVRQRQFADGAPWEIRPIRPDDAEPLQAFIRGLSEETRYMRFVSMMRELTPRMLARYTQIDYHREFALVATTRVPNPANRGLPMEIIIGLAHYLRNADGRGAEYALVVADDWQRRRLGRELMGTLIEAAAAQGLEYIDGLVLANNRPMLSLMTSLGFVNDVDAEDPTMRRVWLGLRPAPAL